jgi:hypothetical protein
VGISTTYAKATEIDELNSAAGQDAILLARIHAQLVSYDRVLQMRTARGALTSQQADSLLQRRLNDLAKAPSAPTAQTREEREEAKLFFDFIERTAASSAHWPSVNTPEYYRALVKLIVLRTRAEHDAALAAGKNTAQALDDAYRALALTRGQDNIPTTPFSNSSSRALGAMGMTDLPSMGPDTTESALEFNTDRHGQDFASLDVQSPTVTECENACAKDAKCNAFTFTYAGDVRPRAHCWLKSGVPEARAQAYLISGVKKMPAGRLIGCFRDTNNPLDLGGYLERSRQNTPERCLGMCKSKGFRFAGVQYGESCLCGNSFGRYGVADNCNMACTGSSAQKCGGTNANAIYATGL